MEQNKIKDVRFCISTQKEVIEDKNVIFNTVKNKFLTIDSNLIVSSTISNWIRELFNEHKQVIQDEKTILVEANLPRDKYPIDEMEFEGEIYPFLKTRLTVNKDHSDYAFITYIFNGGKEKFDLELLFEECIEFLKKDEEFKAHKKLKWPQGFTNKGDQRLFEVSRS